MIEELLLETLEQDTICRSSLTLIFGLLILKLFEDFSLQITGGWTFDKLIESDLTHFDF